MSEVNPLIQHFFSLKVREVDVVNLVRFLKDKTDREIKTFFKHQMSLKNGQKHPVLRACTVYNQQMDANIMREEKKQARSLLMFNEDIAKGV